MVKIAEILVTYSDEGESDDLQVPTPPHSCDCWSQTSSTWLFKPRYLLCHLSVQTRLDSLQEQSNTTSATSSHVVLQLEHAQSLLLQFQEVFSEVAPWLEETQTLIGQLSLNTISHEAFREQQDLLQVGENLPLRITGAAFFLCYCAAQQRRSCTLYSLPMFS